MSRKTFKLYTIFITMTIGGLIGWAISTGNALIPVPTSIVGMVILYLLRKRVKEVVEDERVYSIADRASRLTIQILGLIIAVAGCTLVAASRGDSPDLTQAGFALVYAACGLLILYYISYIYYSKKLSGKE